MATRPHTPTSWGALASMLLALAIGFAPIAVMLTLYERISAEVAL